MEMMTLYQHVRLRPGMYGLHGNYFCRVFEEVVLELLHQYSFTTLKITTNPTKNQIIFEASERLDFSTVSVPMPAMYSVESATPGEIKESFALLIASGVSATAKFSAEYADGSFRRTIIQDAEVREDSFPFCGNRDLTRLECDFTLPAEHPVDESFVRGNVHRFSKIFAHCRIILNGGEYKGSDTKNQITWFLLLGREHTLPAMQIYEFKGQSGSLFWEVSFSFDTDKKQLFSFINGEETDEGGTYVDHVTKAIEDAFRKAGKEDVPLDKMSLAVSIHLPPREKIHFDGCRGCKSAHQLISDHPEFQLIARDLKSQISQSLQKKK